MQLILHIAALVLLAFACGETTTITAVQSTQARVVCGDAFSGTLSTDEAPLGSPEAQAQAAAIWRALGRYECRKPGNIDALTCTIGLQPTQDGGAN